MFELETVGQRSCLYTICVNIHSSSSSGLAARRLGINIDSFMKWVTSFEDNHKITNMGILRALGHQFMIN